MLNFSRYLGNCQCFYQNGTQQYEVTRITNVGRTSNVKIKFMVEMHFNHDTSQVSAIGLSYIVDMYTNNEPIGSRCDQDNGQ